jgi:hypothetical protein
MKTTLSLIGYAALVTAFLACLAGLWLLSRVCRTGRAAWAGMRQGGELPPCLLGLFSRLDAAHERLFGDDE